MVKEGESGGTHAHGKIGGDEDSTVKRERCSIVPEAKACGATRMHPDGRALHCTAEIVAIKAPRVATADGVVRRTAALGGTELALELALTSRAAMV